MKRYLSAVLLFCVSTCSYAQGMFGAHAGLGYTSGYQSSITPAIEAYYLHKITHRIYAGGALFLQRYALTAAQTTNSPIAYGDIIAIRQKSSFLFIDPKIDYGIGYRKFIHVFATFGPGIFMGGRQWSDTHKPYWTPPGGVPFGADTIAVNTTYNIPSVVMRFGFGVMERIPTHRYWNITLSQEVGFMPGGISKGNPALQTPYISFQVGVMHKYPHVFVEY